MRTVALIVVRRTPDPLLLTLLSFQQFIRPGMEAWVWVNHDGDTPDEVDQLCLDIASRFDFVTRRLQGINWLYGHGGALDAMLDISDINGFDVITTVDSDICIREDPWDLIYARLDNGADCVAPARLIEFDGRDIIVLNQGPFIYQPRIDPYFTTFNAQSLRTLRFAGNARFDPIADWWRKRFYDVGGLVLKAMHASGQRLDELPELRTLVTHYGNMSWIEQSGEHKSNRLAQLELIRDEIRKFGENPTGL